MSLLPESESSSGLPQREAECSRTAGNNESMKTSRTVLSSKIEHLKNISASMRSLSKVLSDFKRVHKIFVKRQETLARFMDESGKVDSSQAGQALRVTGQFLFFVSRSQSSLDTHLSRLNDRMQAFSVHAVKDAFQELRETEKCRKMYDKNLVWLQFISNKSSHKDETFKKQLNEVQKIFKKTKFILAKKEAKAIQKIDLLSLSRCNMFSTNLRLYVNSAINCFNEMAYLSDFAHGLIINSSNNLSLSNTLKKYLGVGNDFNCNKPRRSKKKTRKPSHTKTPVTESQIQNLIDLDTCESQPLSETTSSGLRGATATSAPPSSGSERASSDVGAECSANQWVDLLNEFDPLNDKLQNCGAQC